MTQEKVTTGIREFLRVRHPETAYVVDRERNLHPDLKGMLLDRRRLLKQLVPLLRRIGASHPDRAKLNADRSIRRKTVRKALRANADAIAARLLELDDA